MRGITEILDHGFFYQPTEHTGLPLGPYVALNITEDQLGMQRASTEPLDAEQYYSELRRTLVHIVERHQLSILLVPHIYSDLRAINQLLARLDDWFVRQHITIAPCIQGDNGADYLFNLYRLSSLVIGMRFHTNVCSLAMELKVIGLVALDRINYLYNSLGITDSCVSVTGAFSQQLNKTIDTKLKQAEAGTLTELENRKVQTATYYQGVLSQFGLTTLK
ncbi:polysaccharide pyruvyl transferase family protein [Arsukibacterium sp.]|uniref:polysaccharide pyruvyl transferase family protein n=1 Tax=Arsukibacterium sp. TaxID=1977258 RepID=UPI001BD4AC19|nr:polysaccharide pyruvyl transferase family protein [Arsukibacterium sp.]